MMYWTIVLYFVSISTTTASLKSFGKFQSFIVSCFKIVWLTSRLQVPPAIPTRYTHNLVLTWSSTIRKYSRIFLWSRNWISYKHGWILRARNYFFFIFCFFSRTVSFQTRIVNPFEQSRPLDIDTDTEIEIVRLLMNGWSDKTRIPSELLRYNT